MFSDKFRQYSSRVYAERREYIAKNTADIIAAQKDDMRTALEYLYGTLPLDDVRFTPFEWMEEACAAALATRAANQYGADIPEDIFAQYVLCPRVNNERAQRHRRFFAEKHSGCGAEREPMVLRTSNIPFFGRSHGGAYYRISFGHRPLRRRIGIRGMRITQRRYTGAAGILPMVEPLRR